MNFDSSIFLFLVLPFLVLYVNGEYSSNTESNNSGSKNDFADIAASGDGMAAITAIIMIALEIKKINKEE